MVSQESRMKYFDMFDFLTIINSICPLISFQFIMTIQENDTPFSEALKVLLKRKFQLGRGLEVGS
jgi:hypothetical protein